VRGGGGVIPEKGGREGEMIMKLMKVRNRDTIWRGQE